MTTEQDKQYTSKECRRISFILSDRASRMESKRDYETATKLRALALLWGKRNAAGGWSPGDPDPEPYTEPTATAEVAISAALLEDRVKQYGSEEAGLKAIGQYALEKFFDQMHAEISKDIDETLYGKPVDPTRAPG